MEVRLQKENIGFLRKIADANFNHEETMEMIVPDTLPDVLEITDTDGMAIMRSKEADSGKLTVNGIVRAHVIYTPEGESGLRSLMLQIPFSASYDSSEINGDSKLICKADVAGLETRVINSRKLIVRADIMITASAFDPEELSFATGIEEEAEIEVLTSECEINPIVEVTEKSFSFSDELSFPASKPPIGSIVKSGVRLVAEELKTVGSKLIIKGTAYITVVYTTPSSSELNSFDLSVPFSQIAELSNEGDDLSFDVNLMPTGVFIQESGDEMSGNQGISVEIAAVAQITVWRKRKENYISDIYSTYCETQSEFGEHSMLCLVSDQTLRETARETISATGQVRSIICVSVYPGRVRRDGEGFKASIGAGVLYSTEDGKTAKASGRFELTFPYDFPPGSEVATSMQLAEVFASPTAGGIELRVNAELRIREYRTCCISPVASINYDEEQCKEVSNLPSVVLCRVGESDSLWSLAKRYNSTRELIRQANNMDENASIRENDLLLIAKRR